MNFLLSMPDVSIWRILLDFYIVWIFTLLILKLIFSNSRLLNLSLIFVILIFLESVTKKYQIALAYDILKFVTNWYPIAVIVVMGPDLRRMIEMFWRKDTKETNVIMGNEQSRKAIVDAAFYLAERNYGALITIEKHNTLDHFADRAIMMHSEISKELLINIFIPNTPLHDGAVIVRGNEILCAGAYFILSESEVSDKTMGSRHRAALGISEVSDGLTIVVSEETGNVSIALEGILLRMNEPDKLMEYLSMFMR